MTKFLNISTDTTLGGTSAADDVVVSQKAIKTYVDNSGGGGGTPLPDQTGNAGKFLTTDGTSASWGDALTNKATGTSSFSINNSTSNYTYRISTVTGNGNYSTFFGYGAGGSYQYATCVGYNAAVGGESSVCVGALAYAKQCGVSIGRGAGGSYPSNYSVCVGYSCSCVGDHGVSIGYNTKSGNSSSHTYSVAIGASAQSLAANAIQIGKGTNTTASSMFVGSNGGSNYQLLDLTTGNIPIARLGATSSDTDKFLKGDGTWATVSGGSSYAPNLFDYKWADYEITDQSWIKADSFSWQDGTVYSDAYNHLVADISGITASTETIGSYTITYYRANDGHKIVLADQEQTVINIYNESGVAWYYILDTTNTRFKLPRTKWGFIGVRDVVGNYVPESLPNIKGAADVAQGQGYDYRAEGAFAKVGGSGGNWDTNANCRLDFNASRSSSAYQDNAPVQQRATQMYLYFYVGQFSQSATEQTAGINSSLFNGKADLDLVNASVNASSTAKRNITAWGIPDYTAGVTKSFGTSYTADVNGWIYMYAYSNGNTSYTINGITNDLQTGNTGSIYTGASVLIPLKAGDTYSATLAGAVSRSSMIFYPMIGEV